MSADHLEPKPVCGPNETTEDFRLRVRAWAKRIFGWDANVCPFCECIARQRGCSTDECPGNQATKLEADPRLMKALRDELVAYAFTQRGLPVPNPLPTAGAEKIYVSDVYRWIKVGLRAIRKFESDEKDRLFEALANVPRDREPLRMTGLPPSSTKRACLKCGAEYFDDGFTWCPTCDSRGPFGPTAHPQAGARMRATRDWYQANLAAGRAFNDGPGEPAHHRER
jgi:hypothetical protein